VRFLLVPFAVAEARLDAMADRVNGGAVGSEDRFTAETQRGLMAATKRGTASRSPADKLVCDEQ
jgi:hypothetical protein